MDKYYFLDNASTTKVFEEEFDLMKQNNDVGFFNPSASYAQGIASKKCLEESRKTVLNALKGLNGKLIFTSSATESNNMVFQGLNLRAGQVVLISKGEHPSVYNAAHRLEKRGIVVKDVPLEKSGKVDFEEFKKLMTSEVALVSIMHVSNETGAINDIKKLCAYSKMINKNVLFHSDGVQAFCKIKVNVLDLGVDFYSVSAHKVYAPRGIAALWMKNGVRIEPLLVGGGQEEDVRSSTENVAGALAFAYAVKKNTESIQENFDKVANYKNEFLNFLQSSEIAQFLKVNSTQDASPYVLSISFFNIKGEVLMNSLESDGVLISTGSACSSKKAGNRTLQAMGLSSSDVVGSVRVSFSPHEKYDFEYIANCFVKAVLHLEKNNLVNK